MGKKKGGKEKGEPIPVFNADEERSKYSSEIIWGLLVQASQELQEAKLNRKTVQYTAHSIVQELWECVKLCYFPHDQGEPLTHETQLRIRPQEDLEPCPIDSWSRCSIPSKTLSDADPRRLSVLSSISSNANTAKLPSETGRSVARSVRSKATRIAGQRLNTAESHRSRASRFTNRNGLGSSEKEAAEIAKCFVNLEELDNANRGESLTSGKSGSDSSKESLKADTFGETSLGDEKVPRNLSMISHDSEHLSASEEVRLQALRKLERREQAEGERKERVLQLIREEEENVKRIAQELKGKEYTFDHDGNVVVIKSTQADKLPPSHFSIPLVVRPVEEMEAAKNDGGDKALPSSAAHVPPGTKRGRSNNPGSSKQDSSKHAPGKSGKEKRNQDKRKSVQLPRTQPYKVITSFQQQVLKNPHLEVQPGVIFHESGDSRAGPPRPEDTTKMSRANFVNHQSMLESQSVVGLTKSKAAGVGQDAPPTVLDPVTSASGDTARSALSTGDNALPLTANPAPTPVAENDDPNLAITHTADWGQNSSNGRKEPPVLPRNAGPASLARRSGEEPVQARAGRKNSKQVVRRRPRERPFVEAKTTKERKFLPAPLYPSNTGFGKIHPDKNAGLEIASSIIPPIQLENQVNVSPLHRGGAMTNRSARTNLTTVSYNRRGFAKSNNDKIEIKSDRADRLLGITIG